MVTAPADNNSPPDEAVDHNIEELINVITLRLPSLYMIALRRLGNIADAEDAVQDALLSAYKHLNQFKGQSRMSTWLTAIVINSASAKLRRRPTQIHISLDGDDPDQGNYSFSERLSDCRPNPEEVFQKRELTEKLGRLSTRLSSTLHKTLHLRDVEGLSTRETAELLGLTEGAVKTQVSRARIKLKKLVQEDLEKKCAAV